MMLSSLLSRRYRRTALRRKNAAYLAWRHIGNAGRTWRGYLSERQYTEAGAIAGEIAANGIVVGSADRYLGKTGQAALSEVAELVLSLAEQSLENGAGAQTLLRKDYLVQLVPRGHPHPADGPLVRLATDQKLLEIVASYLGLLPSLYSAGFWLNLPTENEPKASQLWHRDPEDLKIVKVFIYLVDVDMDRGPFCYIPGTQPFGRLAGDVPLHKDEMRITDEEMSAAISRSEWKACVGPAYTMIMADTVGYHRGGHAKRDNRILITFTYTSGIPYKKPPFRMKGWPTWPMSDTQRHVLSDVQNRLSNLKADKVD